MFDDQKEPQDMFADVPETAPKPASGAPHPAMPAPAPQAINPSAPMEPVYIKHSPLRAIIIALVALVLIIVAGYVAYRFMVKDAVPQNVKNQITNNSSATTTPDDDDDEPDTATGTTPAPVEDPDDDEPDEGPAAVVDSDGDGLSNDEEIELGTSVAKSDTDADGLGDKEEIKVYDTDPKDPDTDGDGFKDGEEVRNGYNPSGDGKLLEVPKT